MRILKIVQDTDVAQVEAEVTMRLNQGYELHGALIVCDRRKYPVYVQALVLSETYPEKDNG